MTDAEIITEKIPVGHQNAVTRKALHISTGMNDRRIRKAIHEARRKTPILNLQDGSGYYVPDMEDEVDKAELRKYVKQEESRLKSIGWSLAAARKTLSEIT
jgi:hypothetical protein